MDKVSELKRLKDKVYLGEVECNLEFAGEFLARIAEEPEVLDSIPEGALLVPYPVPVPRKSDKAKV